MKSIGIGLIGYGGIGRVHAMAYRNLAYHYGLPADTIRLAGIATTRPDTAERATRETGCPATTDYRTLLAREDIDVVDICVPNRAHEAMVLAAAEAGKHVYCEKPLAMNLDQARRMLAAVEKAGIKHQMTFNFRFVPAVQQARQLIDDGFLGRIFSLRGRYHRASYIDRQKPLSWRLQREIAGGGALFDLGSHLLDLIHFLLGDIAAVRATLETLIPERPVAKGARETGPVDVDDLALLELRLANGAPGFVDISRMGTGATNDLELEIFGDQGALRFNLADPNWLYVYDTRKPANQRGFTRIETVQRYEGQIVPDWSMPMHFVRSHAECQYQFLKAVAEDRPACPDLEAGVRVQAVMEAAYRSSETQRWVPVHEI